MRQIRPADRQGGKRGPRELKKNRLITMFLGTMFSLKSKFLKGYLVSRISLSFFLALIVAFSPVQASAPTSRVVELSSLMELEQLLPRLSETRVVFVGETHDRYDHHLNQLAIIRNQHAHSEQLAIGIEFIQQPFQSVLDDYVAGRIDEATMLRQTEYFDRWRYDFRLYRPIFQYARDKGVPLIALNIDRDVTDAVKREGLEALSEAQKAQLPDDIYRGDEDYHQRLREVFEQHPGATEEAFDSFLLIQLLWDESMAERAADWLQNNPRGNMVILAGSGHIIYGSGIPDRLGRRVDITASSVINLDRAAALDRELGDYVIMSGKQELPASGKLGAILDGKASPPKVLSFVPGSGAKQAGLKKNDAIIQIGDTAINSYADIRIAMLDMQADQEIPVKVSRKRLFGGGMKTLDFNVVLN